MSDTVQAKITVVYDGECPLCQFGVNRVAIEQVRGELELVDARAPKGHPVMQEITRRRIDLDEGMVAVIDGEYFHGADAVQALASITIAQNNIDRLNKAIFSQPKASRFFYPLLKAGRRLALKAKNKPLLNGKKP